jgi:serine/threonine protein kinase
MSPEAGDHVVYTKKTDVWSLGCLLYELIMLEKPFVAPNIYLLNMKIRRGSYKELPKYEGNDYDIWNELIKKMLITKPGERISVRSILDNEYVKNKIKLLGLTYEQSEFFEIPIEFQNKVLSDYTKLDDYSNSISAFLKKNQEKNSEISKKEYDNKLEHHKIELNKIEHHKIERNKIEHHKIELNKIEHHKIELNKIVLNKIVLNKKNEDNIVHIQKKQENNVVPFPKKEVVNDESDQFLPNEKPSRYVSRIKSMMNNINVQVEYN